MDEKEGVKMDVALIKQVIQEKMDQGQSVAIFCSAHQRNQELIKSLTDQIGEGIFLFDVEEIKRIRPDFLIIFQGEKALMEQTTVIYDWGGKHLYIDHEVHVKSRAVRSELVRITKKIIFKSNHKKITDDAIYSDQVDRYWNALMKSGKHYWDGIMYSVNRIEENEQAITFAFGQTNYRNFVYSKAHDFRNKNHTCTTASIALIETSDEYSVLGKMNEDSVFSGQYKCMGGTLDRIDFDGEIVSFDRMFQREISEECGIDLSSSEICHSNESQWLLIRENMAFVGICNRIQLNISKDELQLRFNNKSRNSEDEKEVDQLLFIRSMAEIEAIERHKKADYIDALYRCYFGLDNGKTWAEYTTTTALDFLDF